MSHLSPCAHRDAKSFCPLSSSGFPRTSFRMPPRAHGDKCDTATCGRRLPSLGACRLPQTATRGAAADGPMNNTLALPVLAVVRFYFGEDGSAHLTKHLLIATTIDACAGTSLPMLPSRLLAPSRSVHHPSGTPWRSCWRTGPARSGSCRQCEPAAGGGRDGPHDPEAAAKGNCYGSGPLPRVPHHG
jgi:hypothetical protein